MILFVIWIYRGANNRVIARDRVIAVIGNEQASALVGMWALILNDLEKCHRSAIRLRIAAL